MNQRTIKFRCWEKETKIMRDWESVQKIDKWWEHGALALMQFTGLLDRHGKEIYEGDILGTTVHTRHKVDAKDSTTGREYMQESKRTFKWVVEYDNKTAAFFKKEIGSIGVLNPSAIEQTLAYSKYDEVIGNIYQDENLLK